MKKISKGMKIWAGIFVIFIVVSAIAAYFHFGDRWDDRFYHSGFSGANIPNDPYIGVLYIEGVISAGTSDTLSGGSGYNHGWILNQIDELIYDFNNEALVLFIDSPGGGVYETDELYLKIKEYQEKTERPVFACMGSMAASGGYYTAVAADMIFANRNTLTGSIGITMNTIYDISGFLERYGIKTTTITSGRNKAMGDMTQPLTEEQKVIFQSICDDAYDQFVGIVSEERSLDMADTVKIADGRIYTAKQALNIGLVDQIGTLEDALEELQQKYNLEDCYTIDLYYVDDSFLAKLMRMQNNFKLSGELGTVLELSGKNKETGLNAPVNYYFSF